MIKPAARWVAPLYWSCVALGVVAVAVVFPINGWDPRVLFALTLPVSITLSVRRYGGRAALVFWASSIIVSNLFENMSVLIGVPFGFYHYTMEPKIFHVPAFIGPIYASLGFICWTVANALLGEADRRLEEKGNIFMLPIVAGAVMTMFDLVTDAQASTFAASWVWRDGGRYFGVPESNFFGWWLVTYSFFQIFALYLRAARKPIDEDDSVSTFVAPILLYGLFGVSVYVDFLTGQRSEATDGAGVVWSSEQLLGSMSVVTTFTMIFVTLIALHRVNEGRK